MSNEYQSWLWEQRGLQCVNNLKQGILSLMYRHSFFYIIAFTVITTVAVITVTPACSAAETVIATVNGNAITGNDLNVEMKLLEMEMQLRNRPVSYYQIAQLRSQIIDNLINRDMLYQYATNKKIRIRSEWLTTTMEDLQDQLGGRSALNTYMAAAGLDKNDFKKRLTKGLVVRRLLRRDVVRTIRISEAEMQAFYRDHPDYFQKGEQIRVRQILISEKSGPQGETSARSRIESLQKQLAMGANFAVLALEYSDGPSRSSAGDLGYLTRQQMVPDFADAAFALKPGEISDIVHTAYGYHLIKMIDRLPPQQISYKESREKIERSLRRNKENASVKRFVANLKKKTEIKLNAE